MTVTITQSLRATLAALAVTSLLQSFVACDTDAAPQPAREVAPPQVEAEAATGKGGGAMMADGFNSQNYRSCSGANNQNLPLLRKYMLRAEAVDY